MPQLDLSYYKIEVDETGVLADTVFEGALGFVARIVAKDGTPRALKIPRLLADTDRENHYVCWLTEIEAIIAAKLAGMPGLTSVEFAGQSLLRSTSFVSGRQEAVIVQFSKELRPRFCLVSADIAKKSLTLTPHLESLGWLTFDLWQKAVGYSQGGGGQALMATVVLRRTGAVSAAAETPDLFLLDEQQVGRDHANPMEDTWYLGLPSPVYFWREGTLEHAVRKAKRKTWSWNDHCALCSQLASGLLSLYQEDFVHGDLRPANIMYGGRPEKPADYLLVDYASYGGLAGALSNPVPAEAGQTLVGVAVAEARQSPFYPLERRVGRERENCDTVVIRRAQGMWIIHIGYRSDMLGDPAEKQVNAVGQQPASDKLSSAAEEQITTMMKEQEQAQSSKEWKLGDRIRVRDFVFQVDRWKSGPSGFSLASKLAWIVHNNRILVPLNADSFEGKDRVLSVSRTFPIWQWSMATDFFSLGVTLLYSMFFTPEAEKANDGGSGDPDSDFEAMIALMSSVQYAEVILPNVAAVARLLESIWTDEEFRDQDDFPPKVVARLKLAEESGELKWSRVPKEKLGAERDYRHHEILKDDQVLLGRTWAIAMSVTQTTPGALRVLRAVNRNLAVFVCLIDLAMQLMHRREDLSVARERFRTWMCDDRTTSPKAGIGKVQELLDHIEAMSKGLQRFEDADEFKCPEEEIISYSSKNTTLLRIQVRDLESKLDDSSRNEALLRTQVRDLEPKLAESKAVLEGLLYQNKEVKSFLQKLDEPSTASGRRQGEGTS